eukprot:542533-Rhodomonas_salina.3
MGSLTAQVQGDGRQRPGGSRQLAILDNDGGATGDKVRANACDARKSKVHACDRQQGKLIRKAVIAASVGSCARSEAFPCSYS